MGKPIPFSGSNTNLLGNNRDVQDIPVFRNGVHCVSCWEFTAAELAEILRTGRVFVVVKSGQTQPPIFAGTETTVRDVIADCGVWRKTGDCDPG